MPLRPLVASLYALIALAPLAAAAATAPDFTVADTGGKPVHLADYRGRYVVLEWTNPECPFVQKHYTSRNMQGLQREFGGKGVVWLAINSTNASHGEFRSGAQMAAWMGQQGGAPASTLIDGTSATGRAYGARTTPHMFVIDPSGTLVYSGAIDDRRSANPDDVKTAKNYVRAALTETLAGKPVSTPNTPPYGCSVKY